MPLRQHHFVADRDNNCIGENLIGDADMHVRIVEPAQGIEAYAGFGLFDVDFWAIVFPEDLGYRYVVLFGRKSELLAIGFFVGFIVKKPVQERRMGRIDTDFVQLQPVAVDEALECEREFIWCFETIKRRKGRGVAGAHIGEDDTVAFDARIRRVLDLFVKITVRRFRRLFQAFASVVK